MDRDVFTALQKIIHQESGINLSQEKIPLLQNRLMKRLRTLNLSDEKQYLEIIQTDATGEELKQLINVVSTNVTHFYREGKHFEVFAEQLKACKADPIKVWCAASSSGEEPYTLAMTAAEALGERSKVVKILATDISLKVLAQATRAVYETDQLTKLPSGWVGKYFDTIGADVQVKRQLRDQIVFKRLNLAKHPLPLKGPLHFIFCRNVMIYFDKALRQKLITEFERLLAPGGYLYLSQSENMIGISHNLESVTTSVYRRRS